MLSQVAISAIALGGSSLLGSLAGFVVKRISHRSNDIFLGFCAGMMLAAAIVCLIMEGVEMAHPEGIWQVLIGTAAGVALISAIDLVTPHLHHITGLAEEAPEEHHMNRGRSIDRILLFVIAIAIHKLPEGMATGITFDGHSIDNAWSLTITMALQNVPEGLVVVTPLLMIGVSKWRTLLVGISIALIELSGVFLGYWVGSLSELLLPALLGMAGGAMLYVLSDEMIPETHANGNEKPATYALVFGVLVLLYIHSLGI